MKDANADGKPKDCRYCFYYSRKKCTLDACIYEKPKPQRKRKPKSECEDCPYGRCSPCIGWCTKEILRSIGRGNGK